MNATAQAKNKLVDANILSQPKLNLSASSQMDLFAALVLVDDDLIALSDEVEVLDRVEADTDKALTAGAGAELKDSERENLDFARFMRSASIPLEKVQKILVIASTPDEADATLKSLHLVEETLEIEELNDDEFPAEIDAPQLNIDNSDEVPLKAGDSTGASSTSVYLSMLRSSRYDPPTPELEASLGVRIRAGDMAARDELVNRNMRYVVSIARKYIKTGRPFDDLIQAGCEGLITAATKFNPEIARFTTMASFWIRQRIQRSVASDASIPMPVYLPGQEAHLKRLAEVAETPEEKEHLEGRAAAAAKRLEARRRDTVSLDAIRSGDDDDGTDMLSLMQAEGPSQEERLGRLQLITKLNQFANQISDDRTRNIFMMRVGMHPEHIGESCTLAEISKDYDLSRERVRQIYSLAAKSIATKMEIWAKGSENLPAGFRKNLTNPGKSS